MSAVANPPVERHASAAPVVAGMSDATLGQFCHDCRTPLAVISEFASIVRDELDLPESDESIELLGRIGDRVRDIEGLLCNFDYLRGGGSTDHGASPPAVGQVAPLIAELTPRLEAVASRWRQSLEIDIAPDLPACNAPADAFQEVVMALLNDLGRASKRRVTLRIHAVEEQGAVHLCIWRGDGWTLRELLGEAKEAPRTEVRSFRQRFADIVLSRCGGRLTTRVKDSDTAFAVRLPVP